MLKIYIASSWRNPHYESVCSAVREAGHTVMDWKSGDEALPSWSLMDERFEHATANKSWMPELAKEALSHPRVRATHDRDMRLLDAADALVLLTPCGRSAHFEAGIAAGREMPRAILLFEGVEPEVMTCKMHLLTSVPKLLKWLDRLQRAVIDWERSIKREEVLRATPSDEG
jgi:hypothetical protein